MPSPALSSIVTPPKHLLGHCGSWVHVAQPCTMGCALCGSRGRSWVGGVFCGDLATISSDFQRLPTRPGAVPRPHSPGPLPRTLKDLQLGARGACRVGAGCVAVDDGEAPWRAARSLWGRGKCSGAVLQRFPTACSDCRRVLTPCGVRAALKRSQQCPNHHNRRFPLPGVCASLGGNVVSQHGRRPPLGRRSALWGSCNDFQRLAAIAVAPRRRAAAAHA